MQQQHRLRDNAEFQRVRQQGRSYAMPLLVLYARQSAGEVTRTGITVGKRVGKAVTRNRIKRLVREAVRLRQGELAAGRDLVLVARGPAAAAGYREIAETVDRLFRRAGVLGAAGQRGVAGGVAPEVRGS